MLFLKSLICLETTVTLALLLTMQFFALIVEICSSDFSVITERPISFLCMHITYTFISLIFIYLHYNFLAPNCCELLLSCNDTTC